MKLRIVIAILIILATVYLADGLSIRYRILRSRDPFGTVTIQRYDAIAQKKTVRPSSISKLL